MTLNEVNIIKNSVLDATEAYVDARLNSSDFVKTQIGVTSGNAVVGSDGKYRHTVICNRTTNSQGVTYNNVLSVGNISFPPSSVVFMIIPNAQASNQFILGKLDTSPCNIEGGEIHIGKIGNTDNYYFNVNSTGNVTIKGADSSIQLAQDGSTNYYHVNFDKNGIKLGHTTGDNYNFTVNASDGSVTIKKGSMNINNKFYVDTDGNLSIGGTSSSANFYVQASDGSVTIKKGSMIINNLFKIDTDGNLSIGGTSSSANFYVQSSDGSVTIKKGSITLSNALKIDSSGWLSIGGTSSAANFYVDATGKVTCKDLYANTGGEIGGFKITSNSLGDPLGQHLKAVGMISQDHIYVVDGTSSHVKIYDDEVNILNGQIYIENGTSMTINHSNIYSSDQDSNVVWHSEITTSPEGYLMWA